MRVLKGKCVRFSSVLLAFGLVAAAAPRAVAQTLPQGGWTLHSVDSAGPGYPGTLAFDGNGNTAWTTSWTPNLIPLPHDIQINLGASYDITGFRHLPLQDGSSIGRIRQYEFYVSLDGINWGTAVATGTLPEFVHGPVDQSFSVVTGRYVRLRAAIGRHLRQRPRRWLRTAQHVQFGQRRIRADP